jgi:hypothetical protein
MRHRQKSANESRKSHGYCGNGKACALMLSTFSIEQSLVMDAKVIVNIVDALFGCCSYHTRSVAVCYIGPNMSANHACIHGQKLRQQCS